MERIMRGAQLVGWKANELVQRATKLKNHVSEVGMRTFKRKTKISAKKEDEWARRITAIDTRRCLDVGMLPENVQHKRQKRDASHDNYRQFFSSPVQSAVLEMSHIRHSSHIF
ncbi:unnamed protein product [Toxocara canis]|uniref:Uncharacterized protein n=1 Tax=Toxocara canis TaxID=6265 RepID=A0A183UI44_TOXCA|nr:unnamed protein product [Toxocara canis]